VKFTHLLKRKKLTVNFKTDSWDITTPFNSMQILLKQSFCVSLPSIILSSRLLRKQTFTSMGSKGHICTWPVVTGSFWSILFVSFFQICWLTSGRHGGLVVSALDFGSSVPGSSPGQRHCVLFLGKTLYSHSVFLHPGVQMGKGEFNDGGNSAMG